MDSNTDIQAILNAFGVPAILLSRDYEIVMANDAYLRHYAVTTGARRQHCYEVSHKYSVPCDLAGESCPLKQSLDSGQHARVLHIHHTPRGEEYVNVEMWPIKDPSTGEVRFFIEQMRPSEVAATSASPRQLVGRSPSFRAMLDLVERVAPSDATALLLGESGTGKELVAQTIHRLSDRRDQPFVPVECAGLPATLFESELFGHVKGAFTGATASKTGLVKAADAGTLFLDEVGEIPLTEQVKLLRLLETRRYRPVGSTDWREVDFRLVCATNRDLSAMVAAGGFREDLYYRLSVFEIVLPALRERREDLEILVDTILDRLDRTDVRLGEDALECLRAYSFPGNVRELRNVVERAVLLTDDGVIRARHLPSRCQLERPTSGAAESDIVTLEEAERRYLQRALALHDGNRSELAAKLGLSERVLYRKLADLKRR
jgi:two-component system response regulator HydG